MPKTVVRFFYPTRGRANTYETGEALNGLGDVSGLVWACGCCVLFVLQVKWLSFVGAVFTELMGRQVSASRAESIAKQIFPLLVEGLDHPFKACREEIAR